MNTPTTSVPLLNTTPDKDRAIAIVMENLDAAARLIYEMREAFHASMSFDSMNTADSAEFCVFSWRKIDAIRSMRFDITDTLHAADIALEVMESARVDAGRRLNPEVLTARPCDPNVYLPKESKVRHDANTSDLRSWAIRVRAAAREQIVHTV